MSDSRAFDIVVYGATGFTGALIAEHLLSHAPSEIRLALGGRNRKKLEELRAELLEKTASQRELPILIADSADDKALDEMARGARVICSAVGPYAKYGLRLLQACVDNGTDYCDLTGEVEFVRASIDTHHQRAQETGARLVHCCGYDSVPSDLGVFMVQEEAKARFGRYCDSIAFFAGETKGTFSGGTIATMLNMFDSVAKDPTLRRVAADPYALNPASERSGPDGPDQRGVAFDKRIDMWTAPFIMAAINTRVVRRSHALLGFPWGRGFRYSEAMSMGKGIKGLARSVGFTSGLGAFFLSLVNPLTTQIVRKRLPKPGEGPNAQAREDGFFVSRLVGEGETPRGEKFSVRGEVRGDKDPGYGSTAIMVGEAALTLALGGIGVREEGGVLTPSTALGSTFIERLRAAGMGWQVTTHPAHLRKDGDQSNVHPSA